MIALYRKNMEDKAEALIIHIFKGDLKNILAPEEIAHWYGALLIATKAFVGSMIAKGASDLALESIQELAGGRPSRFPKARG